MQQPLGYLVDPEDDRDFLVERMLMGTAAVPERCGTLADGFDKTLVQHAESCTGFAIAAGLYASWVAGGVRSPQLASALFIWWNSRKQHGAESLNMGTYIRVAFKQLRTIGFCPESAWKSLNGYDFSNCDVQPPRSAFRAAYDQRMTDLEFYRIGSTGDERVAAWKTALSQECPVVFGMPVARNYITLKEHDAFEANEGDIIGGHAQCALGYDAKGPFGPGTWGSDFGNDGWWHLSWDFVIANAMDQWAFRAPQYFSVKG